MITLYHCINARSFRPLWAMEEMGLSYTLKMLPFPPRVLAPEYLEINPLGTIPAFFDGDTFMTESTAICQYLAGRYGPTSLNVLPDEKAYGAFENFMHYGDTTLTFPQTLVLRYRDLEEGERKNPQIVDDYTRWFFNRLRTIERIVANEPYICAGRFTMADIAVSYALLLAGTLGLADNFKEPIKDYWKRLTARDGFKRADARQIFEQKKMEEGKS
jgi:glutathione S-transferase